LTSYLYLNSLQHYLLSTTTPQKSQPNGTATWIGGMIAAVVLIAGSIVRMAIKPSLQNQPTPEQNTSQ